MIEFFLPNFSSIMPAIGEKTRAATSNDLKISYTLSIILHHDEGNLEFSQRPVLSFTVVGHKGRHVHVYSLNGKQRNEDTDKKVSPLLDLFSTERFLGSFFSFSFPSFLQLLVLNPRDIKSFIHIFVNASKMLFLLRKLPLVVMAEYALPLSPVLLLAIHGQPRVYLVPEVFMGHRADVAPALRARHVLLVVRAQLARDVTSLTYPEICFHYSIGGGGSCY